MFVAMHLLQGTELGLKELQNLLGPCSSLLSPSSNQQFMISATRTTATTITSPISIPSITVSATRQVLYELVHVHRLNPANNLLVCYSYFTDEKNNLKSVTFAKVS